MGEGKSGQVQSRLSAGLLAHVDAGKTTLSEAMLYLSGAVRKLGRVDHGDAFLDTDAQERSRGTYELHKQKTGILHTMPKVAEMKYCHK